jgi:ABC-2 type transport system permease protein
MKWRLKMQATLRNIKLIWRIASKEITLFFASPTAYLFLATFAAISLFIFFWGESFFSRNIADIRPLFEWMPILLLFLTSTLTMRLWSEERRTGTLEYILTQPLPLWYFVVGKFIGCLALLAIALAITIPLPITVSQLGELDWGPIGAGYLAAFFLGAAYLSIGLYVSARSDNQIVSLICAVSLSGLFYLIGTATITDFFGNQAGEWLRLLGTGARFDSITRGVIDLRDLYYYLSIIFVFLSLNVYTLEKERWAENVATARHKVWRSVIILALVNIIGVNLWLGQISSLRIDTTQGQQYSISSATREYLSQLEEPLLIRGYFSGKTHPMLSPLVPQIKDLIREYEIAGKGKIRIDFVDPVSKIEVEEEANQKYGVRPIPLQVADRYQSAIVNSYFHILVGYGEEFEVLDFQDLIETKAQGDKNFEIVLRNPEYDLTRSIKKVLNTYRGGGNIFDSVEGALTLNAYISSDALLPDDLTSHRNDVIEIAKELKTDSKGLFKLNIIDPYKNNSTGAKKLSKLYGLQPLSLNKGYAGDFYYFHLILEKDGMAIQIPLEGKTKASLKRNLRAAIKRFGKGFIKTIGIVQPKDDPKLAQIGLSVPRFTELAGFLGTDLNIRDEDISDGNVSGEIDILLIAAPNGMGPKEVFAIDQFLMKGGAIIAMSSPYTMTLGQGLGLAKLEGEFKDWLKHHGLTMENTLVLDMQNKAFPLPVMRKVGGNQVQEVRMIEYPYFADIRSKGFNSENPITSNLEQVTMAWSSPITVDSMNNSSREVVELIRTSDRSWLSNDTEIMPEIDNEGVAPFSRTGDFGSHLLGVATKGVFTSYFTEKKSPIGSEVVDGEQAAISRNVLEKSPAASQIILFSSNDFLRDQTLTIANSAIGSEYRGSMDLIANTVDWALEDAGLLSIRSRGHFNRTLPSIEYSSQLFWEYLNYGLVVTALLAIALIRRRRKKIKQLRYTNLLTR